MKQLTATSMWMRLICTVLVITSVACDLPRDSDGTLNRIRGGTMRVGVVVDTPWTTDSAGVVGGIEGTMVERLARQLNARVTWMHGQQDVLLTALQNRDLDLVIGGLGASSPWSKQVAFTMPYDVDTVRVPGGRKPIETQHVIAAAPGENAWLMRVERMLIEERPKVAEQLRQGNP
jgi:polar amino acid transport system substrate-binding protein